MEYYLDFYKSVKSYKQYDPDQHYREFKTRKEDEESKKKDALEKT